MRILVVEDEPLIAMMLVDWIIELGKEPIGPAANVTTALQVLQDQVVEAAIVDMHLGRERCDPIARELDARRIPWILTSGEAKTEVGLMARCVAYLSKPYDFASVQETVSRLQNVRYGISPP